MHWLLEKDIFEENLERLQESILNIGDTFSIFNYIPFGGGIETKFNIPELNGSIYNNDPIFAYGSLQAIKYFQKSNFSVVCFCNLPQFECSFYYPRFGNFLFQKNYCFLPYGEINRRKNWLFNTFGNEGQIFCRPNDGFKTFTGQLLSRESWIKDYELIGFYDVSPETLCIVSEPQNIVEECRIVIGCEYDGPQRIITGSVYKIDGKILDQNIEVKDNHPSWKFVESVLASVNYSPDPFWVIDVAKTRSEEWKVLEVGSMSCCGLYECNLDLIVKSISDYHKEEWDQCVIKKES